jgi:hypothetical protein
MCSTAYMHTYYCTIQPIEAYHYKSKIIEFLSIKNGPIYFFRIPKRKSYAPSIWRTGQMLRLYGERYQSARGGKIFSAIKSINTRGIPLAMSIRWSSEAGSVNIDCVSVSTVELTHVYSPLVLALQCARCSVCAVCQAKLKSTYPSWSSNFTYLLYY